MVLYTELFYAIIPACFHTFCCSVIPTSPYIFNVFYTCICNLKLATQRCVVLQVWCPVQLFPYCMGFMKLLHPDCVCLSGWCSLIVSASTAVPRYICCLGPIASTCAFASRSCPLQLLPSDHIRFTCCSWIVSASSLGHSGRFSPCNYPSFSCNLRRV